MNKVMNRRGEVICVDINKSFFRYLWQFYRASLRRKGSIAMALVEVDYYFGIDTANLLSRLVL